MTAKERVLAVYPEARAVKIGDVLCFYRVALDATTWGDAGTTAKNAWERTARSIPSTGGPTCG